MTALIVLIIAIVALALWLWATYNSLVKTNERVEEAWSDITVQLKRRLDLVPNLINTVKGYAAHEKEVFEQVTKTRAETLSAQGKGPKETAEAENQFEQALKSIFAVAEAYPELKANENFKALQDELVDTEDKIQAARRFYNGATRDLNIKVKVFPTNLFAKQLGFKEREFFEVEDMASVSQPVAVDFNNKQ
jgi:LemA protein